MKPIFFLLLTLSIPRLAAQPLHFVGVFPALSQTGTLSKKILYSVYASATIDAFDQTVENIRYPATNLQLYVQPGIVYKIKPDWQAAVGYAYARHNLFGLRVNENRLWAQTVYNHALPKGRLAHRLRYEERYPLNLKTNIQSKATLLRYQLGYHFQLYDSKTQKQGFSISASHEVFLCLTGAKNSPVSSKNAFCGENWSYAGVGYTTAKAGRIEAGYMLQNLVRNPQRDHRYLHLFQITYHSTFRLDDLLVWLYTPY
ncbi:DUF2490 domain-containing protein [Larkinella humicola]|uniref:DUF2490 domain-containing protein n=1 Tax=Larkinella humicola TaxID=2607654 RepID=A0A5N1JBT7_9BACT|nr:DUF2490 domain-containing protein [Larkinella humicola]KAA9349203.1 DUF2490 domain-containing protein [Larkinella humicola]